MYIYTFRRSLTFGINRLYANVLCYNQKIPTECKNTTEKRFPVYEKKFNLKIKPKIRNRKLE